MQIIKDFLEAHNITENKFVIGVSGGADSLALALLFKLEFPDYDIVALTVDHQLRPSSRKEANYVAKVMADFGIEHHILTWNDPKPSTGVEEAARNARYNLLCTWCRDHHVTNLVIAHHLFDQAETFLMRLQRGSGVFGLSAMQEISMRDNIKILRPLLNVHPDVLKNFLKERNISWVEDESNQCPDFFFFLIRQFLPELEKETGITVNRLVLAAQNLCRTRSFIEYIVQNIIDNKVHLWGNCGASFDYIEFLSWHSELKFYILNRLICDISDQMYTPEANALYTLIKNLETETFSNATLGGLYFCKSDLRLWLIKENRNVNVCVTEADWVDFEKHTPQVRGVKIPAKLRQALVYEKKNEK